MNYFYSFIEEVKDMSALQYDVLLTAYDGCERTAVPYEKVNANRKYWFVFPQYNQDASERPQQALYSDSLSESSFVLETMDNVDICPDCKLCIDATGFLIPHLLFLIQYIKRRGIKHFDVIYSEPAKYEKGEDTTFTRRENQAKPIEGYSIISDQINGSEILIVFAGYNSNLVNIVAKDKSKAKYKHFFTGFPSLQADMYQQNLIQLAGSRSIIGETNVNYDKAPAYDPFIAACKVQEIIDQHIHQDSSVSAIHLAPLSTKPMAVACALVYLNNDALPIDIIYPTSDIYVSGHALGINRTWRYEIEF